MRKDPGIFVLVAHSSLPRHEQVTGLIPGGDTKICSLRFHSFVIKTSKKKNATGVEIEKVTFRKQDIDSSNGTFRI